MSVIGVTYRVYCEDEAAMLHTDILRRGATVVCPTDAGHTLTAAKTSAIFEVGHTERFSCGFATDSCTSKVQATKDVWLDLVQQLYEGTDTATLYSMFVEVASEDVSLVTMDVRVIDVDTANVVALVEGHSCASDNIFETLDLGVLSNLPTGESDLMLQIKKLEAGSSSDKVKVSSFVCYE